MHAFVYRFTTLAFFFLDEEKNNEMVQKNVRYIKKVIQPVKYK